MIIWGAFSRLSHKQMTPIQMNSLLKKLNAMEKEFLYREPLPGETFSNRCYLKWTEVQFYVAYKLGGKAIVNWCYLDGRGFDTGTIEGKRAYAIMAQYYKPPRFEQSICSKLDPSGKPNLGYYSSGPLLYSNPAFHGKRVRGYCYDINSAYGWALEQPIPNTKKLATRRVVGENEIGFLLDGATNSLGWGYRLKMVHKGCFSDYVFPLMESPYTKFVNKWYRKKIYSRKSDDRKYAKMVINEAVGYLQLINPFIRATVVERCNERIRQLMDENTIYCNTDSICSNVPRDLPMGRDIGLFKLEHSGEVAITSYTYQWNTDFPVYRSIPKSRFKKWNESHDRPWDLLQDPLPLDGNEYEYSITERRLILCEEVRNS